MFVWVCVGPGLMPPTACAGVPTFDGFVEALAEEGEERAAPRLLRGRGADACRLSGLERLLRLEHMLRNAHPTVELEAFQERFLEMIVRNLAKAILGSDWRFDGATLMRRRNWPRPRLGVLGLCPRQVGKTFIIALFAVTCAVFYATTKTDEPDHKQLVISAQQSSADIVMDYVKSFLGRMDIDDEIEIVEDNKKSGLTLRGAGGTANICAVPKPNKVSSQHRGRISTVSTCGRASTTSAGARCRAEGLRPRRAAPHRAHISRRELGRTCGTSPGSRRPRDSPGRGAPTRRRGRGTRSRRTGGGRG